MAARRLLIVMLILLGLSTLAAALVPTQSLRDETEGTGSTSSVETVTTPPPEPTGEVQLAVVKVGVGKLPVIPISLGDRLELLICSTRTDFLDIPKIGRIEPVSPESGAYFSLLLTEAGSYAINFVEADAPAARIEVAAAKSPRAPEGPPREPPGGCGGRSLPSGAPQSGPQP
jgi:hypothetical protein